MVSGKGAERGLQRAIYLEPDETAHFDLSSIDIEDGPWGMVEMIRLEDGNEALIFQRGHGAPLRPWSFRR